MSLCFCTGKCAHYNFHQAVAAQAMHTLYFLLWLQSNRHYVIEHEGMVAAFQHAIQQSQPNLPVSLQAAACLAGLLQEDELVSSRVIVQIVLRTAVEGLEVCEASLVCTCAWQGSMT